MTKKAKIIIGTAIAFLLAAAVAAGLFASKGYVPQKSSNQIKGEIETAFEGKDYFKGVEVSTYKGLVESEDPDAPANSAGIQLHISDMSAETFTEVTELLPEIKMTSFYSISNNDKDADLITVTGFSMEDLANPEIVKGITDSLAVQEDYKSSFWQVSMGNAEGDDASRMNTQFVTVEDEVEDVREVVDSLLTDKMDVIPVAKSDLSAGSFVQFGAVKGKMDNFNDGFELALKFADEVFLDGENIVLTGLGDNIQISYDQLRDGLDEKSVTEIAKKLNAEQLFKITVKPAETGNEEPAETEPSPEATSGAEPSASPSEKSENSKEK